MMNHSFKTNFRFSVDRGGTFTDVYAEFDDEQGDTCQRVLKLLSVDPENYPDAPREGIRRVLELETGIPHPRDQPLDTSRIASIRMGTTVSILFIVICTTHLHRQWMLTLFWFFSLSHALSLLMYSTGSYKCITRTDR
jgi:hypothetical protein